MTSEVRTTTSDDLSDLLAKVADLVPSAFPDGVLDADQLLLALGQVQPGASFSFTWPGIDKARADARAATTATLVPDPDASLNWDHARDVLIEGDNLQVLKLLKSAYSRQAKLIYIDPPYNTGEAFTYNDDFSIRESDYLQQTGQVDEQGNVTTSKLEKAGKKHAPWLSMMFPRLAVARHLLRRDGVILVSIDNNEVHHLRLLLDAVFGAANFVDMLTWQGGRKGDAKLVAGGQDYILVYARDRQYLRDLDVRWRERKTGLEEVYAKEADLLTAHGDDFESAGKALRGWFKSLPEGNPAKQHAHFNQIDAGGVWTSGDASSPNLRENLIYEFEGYPSPDNGWRYERAVMERLSADDKILYPDREGGRLRLKRYLRDQENWAPGATFYRERGAAQTALNKLMDGVFFDAPKNPDVLARLFHSMTGDGDLIVDFFAGSGTTGQAIWEQNPRDGKTRNWILVQAPEKPDDSEESGRNALAAGYSTIFEVTAERLRRAAKSVGDDNVGFRVFRARETNLVVEPAIIADDTLTGEAYVQASLMQVQQPPVVDGAQDLDVAWELALKATASRLDARVTERLVSGVKVYEFTRDTEVGSGRLFVSVDAFTIETADELKLNDDDTLILRGDKIDDSTTLTLAPRMQKNLVLLERVAREVSL